MPKPLEKSPSRLHIHLMNQIQKVISDLNLDLSGQTVLTEAATGPFTVTPLIADLAGADRVFALTRNTKYSSPEKAIAQILTLYQAAHKAPRLQFISRLTPRLLTEVDILTNSGNLRPITPEIIGHLKQGTVIPLMFEAWEFRPQDLSLATAHKRKIFVAGTNEHHPKINVFKDLGALSLKILLTNGLTREAAHLTLISDNPFGKSIAAGLIKNGYFVSVIGPKKAFPFKKIRWRGPISSKTRIDGEVVILATTPDCILQNRSNRQRITELILKSKAHTVIALFGDIDAPFLEQQGIQVLPAGFPGGGAMGFLLSELGFSPIIRLQAGGLKVSELIRQTFSKGRDYPTTLKKLRHNRLIQFL